MGIKSWLVIYWHGVFNSVFMSFLFIFAVCLRGWKQSLSPLFNFIFFSMIRPHERQLFLFSLVRGRVQIIFLVIFKGSIQPNQKYKYIFPLVKSNQAHFLMYSSKVSFWPTCNLSISIFSYSIFLLFYISEGNKGKCSSTTFIWELYLTFTLSIKIFQTKIWLYCNSWSIFTEILRNKVVKT